MKEDIYFEKEYAHLYEEIENGKCEEFIFKHSLGVVRYLFIKCEVPIKLDDQVYYDLVTPYGYGGPRIVEGNSEDKQELVTAFKQAFGEYCIDNHIVTEFVRFHPIIRNHLDFQSAYDLTFKRYTIQTRLADIPDPILTEYSASSRRDIRRGLKAGVEYRVIDHPHDLTNFKELYYSTMERNAAEKIYYFDDVYFQRCIDGLGDYLVVVEASYKGKVIGMSLNFVYGDYIHIHLTGTLQEYHELAPAYILQYALVLWGKENDKKLIHHGGGRTGELDDKLYLFKKKFGRNEDLEYYIGRKIWNYVAYEKLCQVVNISSDTDYFPAYRSIKSWVPVN
ncbi:hypothetical protein GPDM_07210 [Planococcus donghaensis MPA1U2]|uniref:Lipid II:glycine glycyltransferase n=1 Tax=Planococcus donghaensis MPA1U2 TaxID=933115 RepID=E7RG44_9BACL|nr:GNAT family N-acetyltransferase [Planococcus donghaensis]EGA90051.1 hypothetical protein GPDM_07210 [Planococcus donghaensis MPA1U2]